MGKQLLILIFFIFGFLANAQTHRFIYDVEYRKDSASAVYTKENYHLDITPDEVMYYSRDFFIADSLISNNFPFPKDMKLNPSNIISHKKGSADYDEYDLIESTVLKLRTKDEQSWQLTGEKKQVNNLTLQKAVAKWGGREWIAWFTSEIPFPEGPYKFHGLPGLIAELTDTRDNYRFRLVKSENIKDGEENVYIGMSKKMSVAVSREKYRATKLKYYESPIGFIRNGDSGNEDFFLNDGTVVNARNRREMDDRLRKTLKKYNNPVELDQAIMYP